MVEGYNRRNRAMGVYFREMFALLYNVNRSEKTPYLPAEDVLRLPGEKKRRTKKAPALTENQWTDLLTRINTPTPDTPDGRSD